MNKYPSITQYHHRSIITVHNLFNLRKHSAMTLWLVTRLFCVVCCAVLSNSFPSRDGTVGSPYFKRFDDLEVSVDQETLSMRNHKAVSIEDFQEIDRWSEIGQQGNETMAMIDVQVHDVKHKIGNSSRKKRSFQEDPDPCQNAKIDAISTVKSGSKYAFQGDYYWKLLENEVDEAYPRRISEDWDGLEGNLDAAFTFSSGETYFFKGTKYWRFVNKTMDRGFPKPIADGFEGIPNDLDAAFVWGQNDKTYFFKGNQYWRYDKGQEPPVHPDYPYPVTYWSDLVADGIDAAVQWDNGITYFFKDQHYYRYDDENSEVLEYSPPYPRLTSKYWFGCL